ncbi:hypothetical protein P154DRAFT_601528 [Amniculicola lignicola CBS 123094]|uniref:Uncharacterized protein n=1 Tax=Amniculicola lignicola CBS 123094 TaxID=1392246 RepID=A0A6A5WGV8_9PLEO|nr:hypothetical protein P154DRAFT_601528 [Amniculicola lignicola CBS 123094]
MGVDIPEPCVTRDRALREETRYWVHAESCYVYADFPDALTEVIWNAGKVATALNLRDARLEPWLQWMFGFGYTENDALGTPWVDYVYSTFNRIGQMTSESTQANANIRFYCDEEARWSMVDVNGDTVAEPADRTSTEYREGVFWDRTNDALVQGKALMCKTPDSLGGSDLAYASSFLNNAYDKVRRKAPSFPRSAQNADREIIQICAKLFNDGIHLGALTLRDLATLDLSKLKNLPGVAPVLTTVLTHELIHNPLISETKYFELSGTGATVGKKVAFGTDSHPPMMDPSIAAHAGNTRVRGKYFYDDTQVPGERLKAEWAIMNPDSYAMLATLYRLYGKQWNNQRGSDGKITLFKDKTLPNVGDWDVTSRSCSANSDCDSGCCDVSGYTCTAEDEHVGIDEYQIHASLEHQQQNLNLYLMISTAGPAPRMGVVQMPWRAVGMGVAIIGCLFLYHVTVYLLHHPATIHHFGASKQ